MNRPKVLVIGLDGATWDLIKPLMEKGRMPTIKGLVKKGAYGNLRSTIPSATAPAWVSFYTGKNPGKHGIYDFVTSPGHLVNSRLVRGKKLWQILSENGFSCCVINVPITYPPEEINGCMISCLLTPPGRKDFVYPASFMEILERNGYRIDLEFERYGLLPDDKWSFGKRWDLLGESYDVSEKRCKTALDLLEKNAWDFFLIVFRQTDNLQHLFWDRKDVLLNFYQKVDEQIAEIITQFKAKCCERGDEIFVLLLSDHGFGPNRKQFNIYAWIKQQKFIGAKAQLDISSWSAARKLYSAFLDRIPVLKLLPFQKVAHAPKIYESVKSKIPFHRGESGIYFEKIGKDYELLRERMINELKKVKDPQTGKKVFEGVWRREEIYRGPYVKNAPDIILLPKPGFSITYRFSRIDDIWLESILPGGHDGYPYGILVLNGPCIRENTKLEGITIYDVTPTILYLMGLPILEDMDGKVITQAIKPNFLQKHPIEYQKYETEPKEEGKVYTEEEEEKIKQRLKSLGYLD